MFAPGRRVGPYEILHVLGSGGMGTVCLARDVRLGRQVALKFLQADLAAQDGDRGHRRLRTEARAASALNHPGICQIYDVGGEDEDAWIAMEYVDGTPLDTLIARGSLPADTVRRIGIQLANALAHAHERGIIHRDLKSANIVCDKDGHPKILDFGIAAQLPERVAHEVTRTSTSPASPSAAGSIPYMAPELLLGLPPDERSDLWSLGVVMYEMLTGRRPFSGRTSFETSKAILDGTIKPLPSSVPAPLARVVTRLLSRDPANRYARASELTAALDVDAPHDEPPTRSRRRVHPALLMLAVACGLVAALVVWRVGRFTPLRLVEQRLVSTAEASHRGPSYSPDGTMLAFVAPDVRGIDQIWVRNLATGAALQITSAEARADRPRWSPRSDHIVYGVADQGLWSVSPLGGASKRLIERGSNPNFSSDGNRLVFEDRRTIWTAAADGSDIVEVKGTPRLYYGLPMGPAFSPDGSTIAFFHAETGPMGDIWTIPAAGGTPKRVTLDLREGGWPVWTPDGQSIIFSSARAGSRTLWQVRAGGGEPVALTTGAGEDDQPDISADGRRLAYTNVRNAWDLRVRNLQTGQERSILRRGVEILFPAFSPNGERLTFFGRSDFATAIFTIGVDGSDMRQLTGGREINHHPRWAHDGQSIYFFQLAPTISFRRVPALGGPSAEFRAWRWQTEHAPRFSPDGRFIAYTRQRSIDAPRSDPEHTVIQEAATGQERAWPEPHLHVGDWSADGRAVVGWRHDGKIVICEVADWNCRLLTTGGATPVWPPRTGRIYFIRTGTPAATHELWSIAEDGTDERREMDLGAFRSIDVWFDVSRNGDVAWAPFQGGRHELWSATLK